MIPSHYIYDRAACREVDPTWFDVTEENLAVLALSYCAICTVVSECEKLVRPRASFYDGVAGGKVWSNGRRVDGVQGVMGR